MSRLMMRPTWYLSRLRDEMTPISLVRGQLCDQRVKWTLYQEKNEEALKGSFVSTTVRLSVVKMLFSSPTEYRIKPRASI